jgi:hypothetical protein
MKHGIATIHCFAEAFRVAEITYTILDLKRLQQGTGRCLPDKASNGNVVLTKPLDKVATNESTSASNQYLFHFFVPKF